jgi:hypothetical protein
MKLSKVLRRVGSFTAPKSPRSPTNSSIKRTFSSATTDDMLLQNSFDDWSKVKLFSSSLFCTKSIKEAETLISKDVVPGFADAIIVHVDLQNPLLKKYGFDAEEFYGGARVSGRVYQAVLSVLIIMSS